MTSRVRVTVIGLNELRRKARGDVTIGEPFKKAMDDIGKDFVAVAQRAAPKGKTGDMASHFVYKVANAAVPKYVTIKNTSKHRRFPYPARQEFDPKMGHRHWMLLAVQSSWDKVESRLKQAAKDVERIWGR